MKQYWKVLHHPEKEPDNEILSFAKGDTENDAIFDALLLTYKQNEEMGLLNGPRKVVKCEPISEDEMLDTIRKVWEKHSIVMTEDVSWFNGNVSKKEFNL